MQRPADSPSIDGQPSDSRSDFDGTVAASTSPSFSWSLGDHQLPVLIGMTSLILLISTVILVLIRRSQEVRRLPDCINEEIPCDPGLAVEASKAVVPPGSLGLPLLGEMLSFVFEVC